MSKNTSNKKLWSDVTYWLGITWNIYIKFVFSKSKKKNTKHVIMD